MASLSPEDTIEKFKLLGLNEQKAKETLKNINVTKSLLAVLKKVRNKILAADGAYTMNYT